MLTYDLEKRGSHSLYEYLYLCMREDILSGKLRAGEKLPSKREMAKNHGIALITVENAYAQLMIEGYVTSREKSGYFVDAVMVRKEGPENRGKGGDVPRPKPVDGGKRKEKPAAKDWLVDFASGAIKEDAFPFATWAKLTRRILNDREEAFLTKPESKGVLELRQAIAEYLKKAKGLDVTADQIVVGPGTEYLHHVLLQLIGRDRIVAVEDPGYKKVGQIYEGSGLKCLHLPVDQNGLVVERLMGSNASLVHISPSHHFPTGCVMPIGRRRELLEWANDQNAYVIEDDYDSEFRFDGRPIPTLASLDGGRVIYMNTFTKTLAPSIRIAYMVLPEALEERFREKLSYYSGAVSSFEQYTLAAFMREGYYERHISRMRNYYRQHRARILQTIAESEIADLVSVEEHSAGLHFILRIKAALDDEAFEEALEREGIRLLPISRYCYGDAEKYRHKFIVYYSDLPRERLKNALSVMRRMMEESQKST